MDAAFRIPMETTKAGRARIASCARNSVSSTTVGLSDGIFFCECSNQLVILDERRDRYFGLTPSLATLLKHAAEVSPLHCPEIERLQELGILRPGGERSVAPTDVQVPTSSVLEGPAFTSSPSLTLFPAVVRSFAAAYWGLKLLGLSETLRIAERWKSQAEPTVNSSPREMYRLAGAFEAARRLLPLKSQCLPNSLALARLLTRWGFVEFELVIGVKIHPFAAHCWVQDQDMLLNEASDYAATFTPIRAV